MQRAKLLAIPALFIASSAFLTACSGPQVAAVESADELATLMEDAGYSCEHWETTPREDDEAGIRESVSCGDGGLVGLVFEDAGNREEHAETLDAIYRPNADSEVFRKAINDYVAAENWHIHGSDEDLAGVADELGLEVESHFD